MTTINERIKDLRKEKGLTQENFGEQIGLKKSAICRIEKAGEGLPERVLKSICTTFHVSEEWLVHGTGEKYTSDADSVLQQLSTEFKLDVSMEALIRTLCELEGPARQALVDFIEESAERMKEARKKATEVKKIPRPEGISKEEWDMMTLFLEHTRREKGTTNSEASSSTGT